VTGGVSRIGSRESSLGNFVWSGGGLGNFVWRCFVMEFLIWGVG